MQSKIVLAICLTFTPVVVEYDPEREVWQLLFLSCIVVGAIRGVYDALKRD